MSLDQFVQWAFKPTFWRVAFWAAVLLLAFSAVGLPYVGWIVMTAFMFAVAFAGWLK